ncbi:hypothetical protein KSP35_03380 [Aquihabitans sp. G128]|uniref:hypothetical protein n=1 Tax=Aquihabitans sp. G128 TaxID=2849779 RepID=UPI001C242E33|nr:hypothetical protein [Aquihabitans sp. G128]QXC61885.1 hypothetical protein KSP35_03380 [Aquihabitans sp. G128]
MTTQPRRLLAGLALAALLATGAAACSSDGSDGAAKTTTTKPDKAATASTTTVDGDTETTTTIGSDDSGPSTTVADDGDRSRQAYVDAFTESFDSSGEILSKDKSECVADKFIDVIGFDKITDAGLTPQQFAAGNGDDFPKSLGIDEDKAGELYDQFEACDVNLADTFIKAFSTEGQAIDAKTEACLRKAVTDEALRASFIASFLGDDDDVDPLDGASACLGVTADDGGATASTVTVAPAPGN